MDVARYFLLRNMDRLSDGDLRWIFVGKTCADDAFLSPVTEPPSLHFPPRMRGTRARLELRSIRHCHFVLIPGADQCSRATSFRNIGRNIEKRGKSQNVMAPENCFQFAEVRF